MISSGYVSGQGKVVEGVAKGIGDAVSQSLGGDTTEKK